MQEITIVTKIDNSSAITAQESLRKEIKNLKLELEGLDKTSNEYKKTLDLIAQKSNLYQEKMNSVKTTSSKFSDIAKNITNILKGLGKGFRDAASGIAIYAKAEANAKNNLDKISRASSLTNRVMNVKGSVDNSQEEALKKQAIAAEDANKALIANSNTQAGLATATSATNNAVAIQGNGLIANTTIVDENTIAEEGLNNQLIIGTGSFKEHLNEIKNDSVALAKLVEDKKTLLQWDNMVLKNNKEEIKDSQELIEGNKLLTKALVEMKKPKSSDLFGLKTEDFDRAIDKVSKRIPATAAFIKEQLKKSLDPTLGILTADIDKELNRLGESTKNAGKGIRTLAQENRDLSKSISETTNEIKKATSAQDTNNQNILKNAEKNAENAKTALKNAENTKTALIDDKKVKVDSATASGELQKRNTMLAFSMAQIVREAPVASMSMDMFFLAISNNLPMLFDQIKAMKAYNKTLVENGKAGEQVNIWKAIGKSLLSANSLMMIGVTLATMYGSEIIKWGKSLFENTKELERHKKALEEINDRTKFAGNIAKNAAQEIATLSLMYKQWNDIKGDNLIIRQKWFNAHKDTLSKTGKGYKDLKSLEKDWAVNGIKDYEKGIMKRAEATAAFNKLVELYDKKLRLEDPLRKIQLKTNQETYDLLRKQAKKELIDYFNYTEYTAEQELKRIGQGGTINMVSNPGAAAMWDFYDFVKAVRNSEVATVQSNKIILSTVDKQINAYSKLADVKEQPVNPVNTDKLENQLDKDRSNILDFTNNIEKVNEDWYSKSKETNDA